MTPEQAQALRAPFPAEQVGKLPKPTKRENAKGRCDECGGWHGLPAVHLDYVGHAAVTDRLLQVDPEWSWKPMACGPNGEPLMTNGGLWIMLTVCGVTRPGFGDEGNGKGTKEIIGDAIRNAAMRFGVALDLWAKEPLGDTEDAARSGAGTPTGEKTGGLADEAGSTPAPDTPFKAPTGKRGSGDVEKLRSELIELVTQLGAADSLASVNSHADEGDTAWLKRQIKSAKETIKARDLEKIPF